MSTRKCKLELELFNVLPQYLPFRMLIGNVSNEESARSLYRNLDKESESIVTPHYGSREYIFAMVGGTFRRGPDI